MAAVDIRSAVATRRPAVDFRGRSYAPGTVFRSGLAVAVLSLFVLIYSYSGERIYFVQYFILAIISAIVLSVSTVVACWGRVNMPRSQQARRAPSNPGKARGTPIILTTAPSAPPAAPAEEGGVEVVARPRAVLEEGAPESRAGPSTAQGEASVPLTTVHIACPRCKTRFKAEGLRPFVAKCPTCGAKGRIK
ncbi:MAG: hypothetical protein HY556_09155 [Euryarchaeota archaeon]|nr:hypothetical protein [Euryarchaeota archaeon]